MEPGWVQQDQIKSPPTCSVPLWVGLCLRCIAAAAGYGWFALDDYTFVIEKGAAWAVDAHVPFGCAYRSTLMPRFFALLLRLATTLGCHDPATRLQFAYALLGMASCPTIVAVYHIARQEGSPRAGRAAAWLAAAYVIMPRICTRALLESAAMIPLALSVWALTASTATAAGPERRRRSLLQATASGALCGLAAMIRFQVGVIAPVLALWACTPQLLWSSRSYGRLAAFAGGGLIAAVAQGALDGLDGRAPLSTPWAYLQYNLAHASQYGESSFVTYGLQFVLLALPPTCLFLAPSIWRAAQTQKLSALLWVTFVFSHSLIRHKEDRFMFPILPLFFVIMGHALAAGPPVLRGLSKTFTRRWHTFGVRLFWGLNAVGVSIVTLSDGQRNWTRPFLQIARETPPGTRVTLALVEPDVVPLYYLDGRAEVRHYRSLTTLKAAQVAAGQTTDYVLLRAPPAPDGAETLRQMGCGPPQCFRGDWVDRLLVLVNRHNLRRAPTQLYRCDGAHAGR